MYYNNYKHNIKNLIPENQLFKLVINKRKESLLTVLY